MKLGHRAALTLWSALAVVCPPRLTVAADALSTPNARTVELVVVGTPDREQWLADLLGPQSAPGASLSISRTEHFEPSDVLGAAPSGTATLYCWVDLRAATRARIYFSARAGKRFLLRDVELSGAFDELDRESLSQVLASSWSALFEDEQVGLSREETVTLLAKRAEPVTPPAAAKPSAAHPNQPANERLTQPSPAPLALRIGAFYGLQAFSSQLWVSQGPGLSLSAGQQRPRRRLALWLTGQYRLPETERDTRIGVRLETIAMRLGVELCWPLESDFENAQRELGVRAGFGFDFTHLSPEPGSADTSADLTPARWTTEPVLTGGLGASTRLTRNAALGLRLFVDVLPKLAVYDLQTTTGTDTLLSPWHVRPGIALEIETR